jgi:hypothetical protein
MHGNSMSKLVLNVVNFISRVIQSALESRIKGLEFVDFDIWSKAHSLSMPTSVETAAKCETHFWKD